MKILKHIIDDMTIYCFYFYFRVDWDNEEKEELSEFEEKNHAKSGEKTKQKI